MTNKNQGWKITKDKKGSGTKKEQIRTEMNSWRKRISDIKESRTKKDQGQKKTKDENN